MKKIKIKALGVVQVRIRSINCYDVKSDLPVLLYSCPLEAAGVPSSPGDYPVRFLFLL